MENMKCKEVETTSPNSANVFAKGFQKKKRFQCTMCDKYFLSDKKLQMHVRLNHVINKIYDCPNCGKISDRRMEKHVIFCSKQKFRCSICYKKFRNTEELNAHEKKHDFKKFQCDECLESFGSKNLLQVHSKIHVQRFFIECDFCETICDNEDSLKAHLNSHTLKYTEESEDPKKKPSRLNFRCKMCRRRFKNECRLKAHSVICYLSVFTCDKCCVNYTTKQGLANHQCCMKDVVYKCNVCNEAFDMKDDLFKHFFIHKFTQGINLCM